MALYEQIVSDARREKDRPLPVGKGGYDPITPELIAYLTGTYVSEVLEADELSRWSAAPAEQKAEHFRELRKNTLAELDEAKGLRGAGDIESIVAGWEGPVHDHSGNRGYHLSEQDPLFAHLCRVFSDANISSWEAILRRLDGEIVPTPEEPPMPARAKGPTGKGVYLDSDIVDGWAKERKPKARTQDAYRRDALLFNEMVGRKSVELLTKADVMTFKHKLIADPERSQTNVRDKLASVRTLLGWAAGEDIIPGNPAQDVRMAVTERKEKRQDFNIDDLNALFSGPVYSKGERPKGYAGGEAAYWLPLIALFMGARREEIGQLRVSDVKRVPYVDEAEKRQEVWCLDITEFSDDDDDDLANSVKTAAGNRLVPIHPTLMQLGFLDYVAKLEDKKGRAFPDLKSVGESDRLTDKWGQWFGEYKRACGVTSKTKVFHSFRHTWKTLANDAKIADRVQRAFQGHEGKDTADKYGAAPAMRIMVEAIASFRVPGLKLPAPPPEWKS
jgi:integrase